MKHEKTFAAIKKLQEVEIEMHRLKNALEMANKALDAKRTWIGLTDEEREMHIRYGSTLEDIALSIEAKLKEKNT